MIMSVSCLLAISGRLAWLISGVSLMTLPPSASYPWSATPTRTDPDYWDTDHTTAIPPTAVLGFRDYGSPWSHLPWSQPMKSLAPFRPRIEPASACVADVTKVVEEVERALQSSPAVKNLYAGTDGEVLGISIHNETIQGLDTLRPDRPIMHFCRDGEAVVKFSLVPNYPGVALKLYYGSYPDAYLEFVAKRLRVEVDFVERPYWQKGPYGEKRVMADSISIVEAEGVELQFNYRYVDTWMELIANVVLRDLIRKHYTYTVRVELNHALQTYLQPMRAPISGT
ncbi:uncharacterized protein LOC135398269 [Ornithodoros turicata]|uniref:uncharacterized protein LOC135398269 n=1 Tax=Ornithodoros turicata TaxID=34597 RepID=UPI00313A1689